jgi:hypothetical protein
MHSRCMPFKVQPRPRPELGSNETWKMATIGEAGIIGPILAIALNVLQNLLIMPSQRFWDGVHIRS